MSLSQFDIVAIADWADVAHDNCPNRRERFDKCRRVFLRVEEALLQALKASLVGVDA